MAFRLRGESAEVGVSIMLAVAGLPSSYERVEIWGGKRVEVLSKKDTLYPGDSSVVVVGSEPGNVYSFVGVVVVDATHILTSNVLNVFAKVDSLDIELLDEVADVLAEAGLGVVGSSIFKYTYPTTRMEFYLLLPTGGSQPDTDCGQETVNFSIQYRSLENRPDVGYQKLIQAKRVLHGLGNGLASIRGIIEALSAAPTFIGVTGTNKTCVHTLPFRFRGPKR